MSRININVISLAIFLTVSFMLTSCASLNVNQEMHEENPRFWEASFYTVEDSLSNAFIYGEYVYYHISGRSNYGAQNGGITKYYRLKIASDSKAEELKLSGKGENYSGSVLMYPDQDGNLYVMYASYLAKYDTHGNEICAEPLSNMPDVPLHMITDSEGNIYVSSGSSIYLFNNDCTYRGKISCTNGCNGFVHIGNKVYYASTGTSIIYEISFDTLSVTDEISVEPLYNQLAGYKDSCVIGTNEGKLYCFDTESNKLEELFRLDSCGISLTGLETLACLDDGTIIIVMPDSSEIAVLRETDHIEKQVITLGTLTPSPTLQNMVAEFNRSNSNYKVEIKQYYDRMAANTLGGLGYQDAITRLQLDIASDNSPDILNLNYDEIAVYAGKDLFEDLSPYLKESGLEVMANVLDAYTFDGTLAALPFAVQLRTVVGRSNSLDGAARWNLDEMISYVENHPSEVTFNANEALMLKYCLKFNQSKFVHWDTYTCSFESEEFYKLLEFCAGFKELRKSESASIINLADYDAALYEVILDTPSDYIVMQQLLGNEDITIIGFPTDDGSGTVVEEKNGSYAISSKSENKEAAWFFIKYLLTTVPECNMRNINNGYPVVSKTRDAYFAEAMSSPWVWTNVNGEPKLVRREISSLIRNGKNAIYYAPFDEELQPIIDLLENAEIAVNNDTTILDIILENAAEYFSGEKSVEEVASQIQSRVMLYLGERK